MSIGIDMTYLTQRNQKIIDAVITAAFANHAKTVMITLFLFPAMAKQGVY